MHTNKSCWMVSFETKHIRATIIMEVESLFALTYALYLIVVFYNPVNRKTTNFANHFQDISIYGLQFLRFSAKLKKNAKLRKSWIHNFDFGFKYCVLDNEHRYITETAAKWLICSVTKSYTCVSWDFVNARREFL